MISVITYKDPALPPPDPMIDESCNALSYDVVYAFNPSAVIDELATIRVFGVLIHTTPPPLPPVFDPATPLPPPLPSYLHSSACSVYGDETAFAHFFILSTY
jgi:hypothetical protein